ncbi:tail fiber domain-containing protein [Enterobacter sp. C2]|uniref:tail fiber domain-containing protein n=1 Tax=Enterobacter sp. C2 TaxID=2870346 RepID=UPI0025708198|nr:tail fiber domain-containing protein [Enterobacter sp. C2]
MIYTTGTIAGSGNTLTGTGTNFAAAGSLIRNGCTVIVMTSPVQVVQITAVNSATQLAVTPAVNPAIPGGTRYAILLSDSLSVDGLAQDIAETFKMYQAYMSGFADVMTGTGNVTITINGTSVTVPAQKSLAQKGANGAVPIASGGTGSTTAAAGLAALGGLPLAGASALTSRYRFSKGAYGLTFDDVPPTGYGGVFAGWNNAPMAYNHNVVTDGTFFADSVHRYVYSGVAAGAFYTGVTASTTEIAYAIGHVRDAGTLSAHFVFNTNGSAYASSGNWVNSSDERIKKDITRIENPLAKMRAIKGCTWFRKDNDNFGIGFIAQDIQTVFPDAVTTNGSSLTMADGEVVKNVLFPDTMGVAAGLHHEAILALMAENEAINTKMESMSSELESLKLVVAQLSEQVNAKKQ